MTLIQRAQDFAHRAHDSIKQTRKYTGEPYWVHTDEVALIGAEVLPIAPPQVMLTVEAIDDIYNDNEEAIAAFHMHDWEEDVVTKLIEQGRFEELAAFRAEYERFPELTKAIVTDLTDVFVKEAYPKMNRAERKQNERERIGKTRPLSKTGKLADLISNTRSIVQHDKDFARTYLREKFALLPYLVDGNPVLLQRATTQTIAAFHALGLTIPALR